MKAILSAMNVLQLSPKDASTVAQRFLPPNLKSNQDRARSALNNLKDLPALMLLFSKITAIRYPSQRWLGQRWYARMKIFYLWFWDTSRMLMVISLQYGEGSTVYDRYLGFITLIIGGKHIGDYRHVIVNYTWEPPREPQARFVLEEPSARTPLAVNKADDYDMIVDLTTGKKNQRKDI